MFRFDNTAKIKRLAETTLLPLTPPGNEQLVHAVGVTVQASGLGSYRKGCIFTIVERYMDNGFAYYKDNNGIVHRTKDIVS